MKRESFQPMSKIEINCNFFDLAAAMWETKTEPERASWILAAGQPGCADLAILRFRQLKPWRQYDLTRVLLLGPLDQFQGVA